MVVVVLNYCALLFAQEQLLGELTFEMNKPHLATRFTNPLAAPSCPLASPASDMPSCLGWKVMKSLHLEMKRRSYRGEILYNLGGGNSNIFYVSTLYLGK